MRLRTISLALLYQILCASPLYLAAMANASVRLQVRRHILLEQVIDSRRPQYEGEKRDKNQF